MRLLKQLVDVGLSPWRDNRGDDDDDDMMESMKRASVMREIVVTVTTC
jgi:hypothetical protein